MQPPHRPLFRGQGLVVLNKLKINSRLFQSGSVPGFRKEAAMISKPFGSDKDDTGQGCGGYFHKYTITLGGPFGLAMT